MNAMNDHKRLVAEPAALIATEAYLSPEYAREEREKLWQKVWQIACREEELPNVGDFVTYDVLDDSIIVVRTAEDQISAYHNACQHRGRRLTEGCGHTKRFACKFHGWKWNLDGTNAEVAHFEGFGGQLDPEELRLAEVRVGLWGGFVFINMDPNAPTLAEYFGPEAMAHFKSWGLENRYIYLHVQKRIPSNWKLNIEAFMEAYHVLDTHPQVSVSNADVNSQYDVYGEHVNRFISSLGVLSPNLQGQYTEQDVLDQFTIGDEQGHDTFRLAVIKSFDKGLAGSLHLAIELSRRCVRHEAQQPQQR